MTDLTDVSTGDVITSARQNLINDYIQDGTHAVNCASLNIAGTEIIDSSRNIADAEVSTHTIGTVAKTTYYGIGTNLTSLPTGGVIYSETETDATEYSTVVLAWTTVKTWTLTPTNSLNKLLGLRYKCDLYKGADTSGVRLKATPTFNTNNVGRDQAGGAEPPIYYSPAWRSNIAGYITTNYLYWSILDTCSNLGLAALTPLGEWGAHFSDAVNNWGVLGYFGIVSLTIEVQLASESAATGMIDNQELTVYWLEMSPVTATGKLV